MIQTFFYELLHMSSVASVAILAVLLCRILLSKAPKVFSYALWGIVLFRLLCPVSIDFSYSLMPASLTVDYQLNDRKETYVAEQEMNDATPETNGAVEQQEIMFPSPEEPDDITVFPILAIVWSIGFGIMLLYSLISFFRLKRRLVGSVPADSSNKVFYSDYIDTPFVVGLISPVVYLPSSLHEQELEYILLHEKHHMKRGDHIWKTVAFFALSLHWFNPLVWVSFILASKDMEMSCDEAVIQKMGKGICTDYSASLLSLATGKRKIAAMPLAFGEGDTRSRITNILGWKEPGKWMVCFAILLCLVVTGCFVTNQGRTVDDIYEEKRYTIAHQEHRDITLEIPKEVLDECIYTEEGQTFKENEVVVYETDTTKIYLEKVMLSNESEDLLYFMFDISYDLPKEGSFLDIYWKSEDGTRSDELWVDSKYLCAENRDFPNAVTLRGSGPQQKFALYVSADACREATGTMQMYVTCAELSYVSGKVKDEPKTIVETYEKNNVVDVYDEWVRDTYYKMSDYFKPENAVIISTWLGKLENCHLERDADTIYIMEERE